MGIFQQFPYSNFHEFNLDQIIKIMREMQDEWNATKTEWASYKEFIDNYFDNLDVSEEVLAALRTMADTGELNTIIDPTIVSETIAWLSEHITQPTTPAIDTSLSIAGAAADAKATGDAISDLQTELKYSTDKYYPDKNLLSSPHLAEFLGSTIGAEIIPNDDCNIIKITNSGTSARCQLQLKQAINTKVYISFYAKKDVPEYTLARVTLSAGVNGGSIAQLGRITLHANWERYTVEYDLTLTDVDYIRFALGDADTVIQITNVIISNSAIDYEYSTKAFLAKTTEKADAAETTLDGNITIDNFEEDLKNVFEYKYRDAGAVFEDGFYIGIDGTRIEVATCHSAEIAATAGDRFKIVSRHGSALRAYVFKNLNDEVVEYFPLESVPTVTETLDFIAPTDGTLYVNSYGGVNYTVLKSDGLIISTASQIAGKRWYALGDSITNFAQGYHAIIASQTGVNVTNGGVSGSGYMKPINNQTFVDRANLSEVYDIVTVFGSVNDMQYVASNLGTETDTGTLTLGGCFNTLIDNLYASGNYHIGIIAPIPQGTTNGNPANNTGTFAQYTELLEKVCRRRGVPYLDLWHCSNMQPWDAEFLSEYMIDNTHPNANGHAIFAPRIRSFIESL